MNENIFIHPLAEVEANVQIGVGTRIWSHAQVRTGAQIGAECNIAKGVYIDFDVVIGSRVKIQFNTVIGHGAAIEDGVMIGPCVSLCNDMFPRAITRDGRLQGKDDWEAGHILVRYGASIGAGVMVIPNVTIGSFAMIGAGSVVTHWLQILRWFMGIRRRCMAMCAAADARSPTFNKHHQALSAGVLTAMKQ